MFINNRYFAGNDLHRRTFEYLCRELDDEGIEYQIINSTDTTKMLSLVTAQGNLSAIIGDYGCGGMDNLIEIYSYEVMFDDVERYSLKDFIAVAKTYDNVQIVPSRNMRHYTINLANGSSYSHTMDKVTGQDLYGSSNKSKRE